MTLLAKDTTSLTRSLSWPPSPTRGEGKKLAVGVLCPLGLPRAIGTVRTAGRRFTGHIGHGASLPEGEWGTMITAVDVITPTTRVSFPSRGRGDHDNVC
jgi:hypothetical protein